MTQDFRQDVKNFIFTRINCSELRLEDNPEYQEALNRINSIDIQSVLEAVDNAIGIAEKSAYMFGLHDGLSLIAELSR